MSSIFASFWNSFKGFSIDSYRLSAIMLIYRSGSMVLPFLGVYLNEYLNFSIKNTGLVLSAYGLGAVFGSYLGGMLTDKIGHWKVQLISLFSSIPGLLILPEITNIIFLILIFFFQSIFNEMFIPANSVAITKHSSIENRARAFSLNRLALNLAFFIGPTIGGIAFTFSYYLLFYINAFMVFVSGIAVYIWFKNISHPKSVNNEQNGFSTPLKDKFFLLFIFFCMIYSVCVMQLFNTIPLFYKSIGFSKVEIGLIFGYCGILLFFIEMPLVKWITGVLNNISIITVGLLLLFLGYLLLVFSSNYYIIVLSITVIAISNILVIPFLSTIVSLRSNSKNMGSYMGIYSSVFSTALFISPLFGTFIVDNFGFVYLWKLISILVFIALIGINTTHMN